MSLMPLATLLLTTSAATSPFGHLMHLHPTMTDNRVSVVMVNRTARFEDLRIDGRTYTVLSGHSVRVKALPGTTIYADDSFGFHRRGDVVLRLDASVNEKTIDMK